MSLLEQVAFVIKNKGWKNTYLIEFVSTTTKDNKLNRNLIDRKVLKKLDDLNS